MTSYLSDFEGDFMQETSSESFHNIISKIGLTMYSIWGHIGHISRSSLYQYSLNDGLLSVRLQLGNVDARGVGERAAKAQNGLETLVPVDRDVHPK